MKRILLTSIVAVAGIALMIAFWKKEPADSGAKMDRAMRDAAISEAETSPGEPSSEPVPEPSLYSIAGESGVLPSAPPAWTAGSRKAAGLPAEDSASPNATK
jgi:hypothetical protein